MTPETVPEFAITDALIERPRSTDIRWVDVRCDWLEDAGRQLRAIAKLADDWDGHGAPSPNANWLKAAWGLLVSLCSVAGLPKPHVNPTPRGGVQFEWENGPRYLEVELVAERAAVYLYRDDARGIEDSGEVFVDDSLDHLVKYALCVEPATELASWHLSTAAAFGTSEAVM